MTNVTDPVAHKAFLAQGAGSAALLADIVLEPTPDPSLPDPNRFPYNEHTDGNICACGADSTGTGCARTEVLKTLESDFGIYVTKQNQFIMGNFVILDNGKLYYHKPGLLAYMNQVNSETAALESQLTEIDSSAPNRYKRSKTLADITQLINSKPAGMPTFIKETTNFYEFDGTGFTSTTVSFDQIDRTMLNRISSTFTGSALPDLFRLNEFLMDVSGKLYFTDLTRWKTDSSYKDVFSGIFALSATATSAYPNADKECYIFAFSPTLTTLQQQTINVGKTFCTTEINRTLVTVNL